MALKKVIALSALLFASSSAVADPFGLPWGEELSHFGSVKNVNGQDVVFTFSTPLPHRIIESYAIYGDKQSLTNKVVGTGYPITGDTFGTEGRRQFSLMISALEKQGYVKQKSDELHGTKIYEKMDAFWQCIKVDGCGEYYWIGVKNSNETAIISLKGKGKGEGHLEVEIKLN
ncbi:hypothetical protein [Shewanella atlantica]|uniref:Uncharacterized protein n=1 Tax=Shewanella atlantica TaxID=271099 RepID=A0A3S0JSW5_9GAMM|nr:hypothetical protein [Shewanella atlantica]RTR28271.1 hypothetical protein EKG39_19270 [Shewanella atlantica]